MDLNIADVVALGGIQIGGQNLVSQFGRRMRLAIEGRRAEHRHQKPPQMSDI